MLQKRPVFKNSKSFTPVSQECLFSEGTLYWSCLLGCDFGVRNLEKGGFRYTEVAMYSKL